MYYTGDYYRGDYYRGDPGIFSFLGTVAKTVGRIGVGAVSGFLGGGLPGAVVGAAGGAGAATAANIRTATLGAGGGGSAYTPAMRARHAEIALRGGTGLIQRGGLAMQGGGGMALATLPGMHVRRLHPNRSTYVTRGGGTSRWPVGLQVHPKGTEAVPSRRMNVGNARALRRSLRRLRGFAKLARKVLVTARHFKKSGVSRGGVRRVRK